jgi:hypothetical protein
VARGRIEADQSSRLCDLAASAARFDNLRHLKSLKLPALPEHALLLVDSAPVIYCLEGHAKFGPYFRPLFDAHAAGRFGFAVTTITIAEVLTGPLTAGDEALSRVRSLRIIS